MGGGGGGGDGGGGSEGGGGGGGEDASRAHRRKKKAARRRRALSCSALCAAARALLRSWRFDGSNGGESVAVPSAGLSLASGFGCIAGFSRKGTHVTVPSTWMRNECILNSFASLAVRRMARRIALLVFGRPSDGPDERIGEKPADEDSMEKSVTELFRDAREVFVVNSIA